MAEQESKSIYRTKNFWPAPNTCAWCLSYTTKKYQYIEFHQPQLGIDSELLIPRGRQLICEACLKELKEI